MSDATGDGGAREASTIDLDLTEADVETPARPRGKPGRRPKGSVPRDRRPICRTSRIPHTS